MAAAVPPLAVLNRQGADNWYAYFGKLYNEAITAGATPGEALIFAALMTWSERPTPQ